MRNGFLRSANDGMLFLDEVGDLSLECQARLLTAIESKHFYPVGGDSLIFSNFQLICCTNQDLHHLVRMGRFRDDLLERINLWHFQLPSLRERKEDLEPNLNFELDHVSNTLGRKISFIKEAREYFLRFAASEQALWPGNFREFSGAITRMAAFEESGFITLPVVQAECAFLLSKWRSVGQESALADFSSSSSCAGESFPVTRSLLGANAMDKMDLFELVQLEYVLGVCRRASSRTEAGKTLFAESRRQKARLNDTDRLTKYLHKFGLDWQRLHAGKTENA